MAINSMRFLLLFTEPEGRAITLVPRSPPSCLGRFAGGETESLWLFTTIGSGTGMLSSWCTSTKARSRNCGVSRISFSCTIVAGKPFSTNDSALVFNESLYSWTCRTILVECFSIISKENCVEENKQQQTRVSEFHTCISNVETCKLILTFLSVALAIILRKLDEFGLNWILFTSKPAK